MPLFGLHKANRRRTVASSSKREDNLKATSSKVPAEADAEEAVESAELDASSAESDDSAKTSGKAADKGSGKAADKGSGKAAGKGSKKAKKTEDADKSGASEDKNASDEKSGSKKADDKDSDDKKADEKSAKKKADKKAEDKGTSGAKQKNRKSAPAKKSKNAAKSGNPAKRASARKQTKYQSGSSDTSVRPNPRWFLPTMLGIIILGMLWLIVFYLSGGEFPVKVWGNWNLLAGFGIMVVGLAMSTRWR